MSSEVEVDLATGFERLAVRIHQHAKNSGALFATSALSATPTELVGGMARLLGWCVGNIDAVNPHFVRILNGATSDPGTTVAGIELAVAATDAHLPTWPGIACPSGIWATGSAGNTLLTVYYSLA